jgi:ornithine cyclodeaminase
LWLAGAVARIAAMPTLLLTHSDVAALLDPAALVPALRAAFVAYSTEHFLRAQRVRAPLPGPGSATVLFPGVVPGTPAYTVKVHAKFPAEEPAIRGVLCLHDASSGALLAVMDSTRLTAVRTGVAGALAAHELARPDADVIAVIGAGVQGREQLRALAALRPIRRVLVHDAVPARAEAYAREMAGVLGIEVEPTATVDAAVGASAIVLAATWARKPFLDRSNLAPGTHVTTLGPDEPGKAEVASEVITDGLFVCDDRGVAVEMGALAGVGLGADAIAAELGEVLAGRHPGRTSDDEITVYGGVGLAFQDAVAAWTVYEAARATRRGRAIDFLA